VPGSPDKINHKTTTNLRFVSSAVVKHLVFWENHRLVLTTS